MLIMSDKCAKDGSPVVYGDYSVVRYIGKGTFGEVFAVRKKDSKEIYALKKIDLRSCGKKDREHAESEVRTLQECRHTNLVRFIESFNQDSNIFIVMEYCERGNLREYIMKQDKIEEDECVSILIQICEGLKYLHGKGIAHRDIKATNIFLTEIKEIKIGDLGLARVMNNPEMVAKLTKTVGSPFYMSPEMINGQTYTKETDIWSLGCNLYEIAMKKPIFTAENIDELQNKIQTRTFTDVEIPEYSLEMNKLFHDMMQVESEKRPSVEAILERLQHHSRIPPKTVFSQSCPPDMAKYIKYIQDRSKVNTKYDVGVSDGNIVNLPVKISDEDKRLLDKARRLEEDIKDNIKGNKEETMAKINESIDNTKDNEDDKIFMTHMKLMLSPAEYSCCEDDLKCMWIYQSKLLKKNFKIALT